MAGNVWEWTSDLWGSSYYSSSPATDPQGPTSGSGRVTRGGGWINSPGYCRASDRFGGTQTGSSDADGFRAAKAPF